jgi:hypothetical protein
MSDWKVWSRKNGNASPILSNGDQHQRQATDQEVEVITASASRLVEAVNASLKRSQYPENKGSREDHLETAKAKLAELIDLSGRFHFLKLTNLDQVSAGIEALEREWRTENASNDDVDLWVFHAGIFFSSSLEELHHHGVMFRGPMSNLPVLVCKSVRSGWQRVTPSFRDLGIDLDEPERHVASEFGTVAAHGEPFLSFLLVFREIIESRMSLQQIESALKILGSRDELTQQIFFKHGPATKLMRRVGLL